MDEVSYAIQVCTLKDGMMHIRTYAANEETVEVVVRMLGEPATEALAPAEPDGYSKRIAL